MVNAYEDHPINWKSASRWFDDGTCGRRRNVLLAGACIHLRNHDIQFLDAGRKLGPRRPWMKAIDHPGASQVNYARKLFESVRIEAGSQINRC